MKADKIKWLSVLNTLSLILVLIMNGLANGLPINNKTTGELSAQYPNLFVPAGFTFSIWGIIYLLLILFVIYQNIQVFTWKKNVQFINLIGPWFITSCLANSFWILAWHYEMVVLSLLIMILLIISLLKIYLNLDIGQTGLPLQVKWAVYIPFSIYLGWITVALIANTTAVLVDINWNGWGLTDIFWTITLILVSTCITLFMIFKKNDIYFSLVILWAYFGIVWKRIFDESVSDFMIITILIFAIIIIIISDINRITQKRNY